MNEIVEIMARAMCEDAGFDPDEIGANDGPRWIRYRPLVDSALAAIEQAGFVVVSKEPTEAMGRVSGMKHRCSCGVRITQWAVNRWPAMIEAANQGRES